MPPERTFWNFIFQGAPGEYIAYADSDIQFFPGWLERSLEILRAYPQTGMVSARPLRTPAALYSSTLDWANNLRWLNKLDDYRLQIEQGSFIPWEIYREHVLSLGTAEEQAHEWYESRGLIPGSPTGASRR